MRTEFFNGGNIQAQIESLMAASRLCEAVQKELHGHAIVHPRDYLGGSESKEYGADVAEWRRMLDSIREVAEYCEGRAMQLDALRSNERQRLAMATMVSDCQSAKAKPRSSNAKP